MSDAHSLGYEAYSREATDVLFTLADFLRRNGFEAVVSSSEKTARISRDKVTVVLDEISASRKVHGVPISLFEDRVKVRGRAIRLFKGKGEDEARKCMNDLEGVEALIRSIPGSALAAGVYVISVETYGVKASNFYARCEMEFDIYLVRYVGRR